MPNLYKIVTRTGIESEKLSKAELASIAYHDIFDFPLTFSELIRWTLGKYDNNVSSGNLKFLNGFYFLNGREGIIFKRALRKRVSERKIKIAQKAANVLRRLPFVKMVAVTGSLAMQNASDTSDIDLMVVARTGLLWTTRLFSYVLLKLTNIPTRKFGDKDEKDKLCLNIWLDEGALGWKNKNVYTAHEIAQIVPLVNKNKTYEKFLFQNRWILNFWPNAVKIKKIDNLAKLDHEGAGLIEKIAFWAQRKYMSPKITRETITPKRALFHPQDWGKVVLDRLKFGL